MREQILELLHDKGPQTVYQLADAMQGDVYEISTVAVGLMDSGRVYLETADGTLWYLEGDE